jgi:hypothetical protein
MPMPSWTVSFTTPTASNSPAKACAGPEANRTRRLDQTSSPVTQSLRPARLATRAASFRYGGRHHSGILGAIIPLYPGDFVGIRTVGSSPMHQIIWRAGTARAYCDRTECQSAASCRDLSRAPRPMWRPVGRLRGSSPMPLLTMPAFAGSLNVGDKPMVVAEGADVRIGGVGVGVGERHRHRDHAGLYMTDRGHHHHHHDRDHR